MKNLFSWILFSICIFAYGTEYTISSVDQFNDLTLSAGDVVIWKDGTYNSDERIKFIGSGTASNPITLKAETPGGVVFNNGLQMDIAGNYLIVDGFYWNGGYGASNFIQFRSGTVYATNSTIQNCAINGLRVNPDDEESGTSVKHRWIVLYGDHNNVINCSFMNKNNAGAIILAEYEYNAAANRCSEVGHTIMNNYFYNFEKIDPALSNAGDSETIRIGTSEFQNVNSAATVSGNYFVQADGENEIITNKSANNSYFNNTFRRCRGSLVMRHGANATVNGNYFLGENVEGTGAIRIADSDHTITNNYIQNCVTTSDFAAWNNGLTFVGGNTSSVPNCTTTSVSNAYQDVENITFSNNTFVNTDSPIYFNASRDGADNVYGTVSDNVIYFDSNNDNVSDIISGSYSDIGNTLTFSGNVYEGTNLGESASGFSSTNLTATSNGEIYSISGASGAGANISNNPLTDNDVSTTVGACFLDANGNDLTGCDGTPPTNSLNASALSTFNAEEGDQTITVTSNVSWSVSESSSWVTVNTTSGSNNGSVIVSVSENTSTSSRSTSITISGSGISRSISVSQEGADDTPSPTFPSIPALIQAENYDSQSGIQTENTSDTGGGENVGYIDTNDSISYNINVPTSGNYTIDFRVASRSNGANFDIYSGNSVIGNVSSSATGGWQTWETVSETVSLNEGDQTIKLVATDKGWNINWLDFSEGDTTDPFLSITSLDTFTADGENQTIDISSNVDWSVSESSSWLSVNTTNGSNDDEITITADENTSTIARSTSITISGGGITRSVSVYQEGAEDIIDPPNDDNLALNGTASQSTTAYNGVASRAIDGNTSGVWGGQSVTHTAAGGSSWWQVDLQQQTNIGDIVIYNRTNCCMDRLSNFTVTVLDEDDNQVYSRTITTTPNPSITINADGVLGKTVRITTNLTTALSLAEVEVYAGEGTVTPPTTNCTAGTNLALNGTIVDYSTQQNTTNTVDNILDGSDTNRWSAEGYSQYAVVDLGDQYAVNEINLYTFNDRDYQFIIEGSSSSASSGFSTLVDASDNSDSGPINRTFTSKTVRYVKLTITGANSYTGSWISITDFEIICAGNSSKSESGIADSISLDEIIETKIYPNPFTETIHIAGDIEEGSFVRVMDISGKTIIRENISGSSNSLTNLSGLAKGLYILQIIKDDQVILTKKLIK